MSRNVSWDDQRIFLAVLEHGSLSAAARALGLSHPTVRSRIEALEQSLGTVLFIRSVGGLAPTETAEALRGAARGMALASDMFVRQASGPPGAIAGSVRISVPEIIGVEVLPAMLETLQHKHPGLRVELSLSNVAADILAHEVDVAVRTATPRQEALVARKVTAIRIGFYASPGYVAHRGMPQTLDDLAHHCLIGPDRNRVDLDFAARLGPQFTPNRFVLRTDSHPAQIAAARAGLGIAVCQVPLGETDPKLIRVLGDVTLTTLDVWVLTHENLAKVPRIRAVLDHLATAFEGWH